MKYCPMLTEGSENIQCLESQCAWWDNGAKECQIQSISKGIWEVAENIYRYIQLMVQS